MIYLIYFLGSVVALLIVITIAQKDAIMYLRDENRDIKKDYDDLWNRFDDN